MPRAKFQTLTEQMFYVLLCLREECYGIDIFDKKWKIYSRNPVLPAQKIGPRAVVQDSLITEGCQIYGRVQHSVLSAGVTVEEGATVEDAVLMDGVVVKAGAVVKRCILAEDVVVGAGARAPLHMWVPALPLAQALP